MSAPDHSDIVKIERRMKEACRRMQSMAGDVGSARTVISYDKDRRRNLLAQAMIKHLKLGESSAAAEQYARADEGFQTQLRGLSDVLDLANATLVSYEVEKTAWETARSLLSMQREVLHTLPDTEM